MRLPCVVINEKYPPVCVNPLLPTLWQGTKVILVPSEEEEQMVSLRQTYIKELKKIDNLLGTLL